MSVVGMSTTTTVVTTRVRSVDLRNDDRVLHYGLRLQLEGRREVLRRLGPPLITFTGLVTNLRQVQHHAEQGNVMAQFLVPSLIWDALDRPTWTVQGEPADEWDRILIRNLMGPRDRIPSRARVRSLGGRSR